MSLLQVDRCFIGDTCFQSGQANPSNPCMRCDSAVDQNEWTETVGMRNTFYFLHEFIY